jgi:predicted secreted Zn-dependent protease
VACARTPLAVGPTPPGVTLDASVAYYDFDAATLAEARRRMREQGPVSEGRNWSAAAHSRYRWNFQYRRQGVSCVLARPRVFLTTTVTFPRWNATAPPDSASERWWQQMNVGLMEHERGHAAISLKAAGEIVEALEGMSSINCDILGRQANEAAQRILASYRRRQDEYDRTTRHGATQIAAARRTTDP